MAEKYIPGTWIFSCDRDGAQYTAPASSNMGAGSIPPGWSVLSVVSSDGEQTRKLFCDQCIGVVLGKFAERVDRVPVEPTPLDPGKEDAPVDPVSGETIPGARLP